MQVALKTINPAGPCPANIMIVADSPGIEEINTGIPFTGYTMRTLVQMLSEKGIALNQCYRTHALKIYAPQDAPEAFVALKKKEISYEHVECNGKFVLQILRDHIELLRHEIARVKPNVIIALGNVALFALTGNWSINAWRGSVLKCILNTELGYDVKVIPTYHPRQINKMWSWRVIGLQDLKRAKLESKDYSFPALAYNFLLKPSYEQCIFVLDQLIMQLDASLVIKEISVDIETKYMTIECIALAWTDTDAICIPFVTQSPYNNIYPFYFTVDQETEIIHRIYRITTHKNCRVIGQNLTYDMQYIQKQWLFVMNGYEDTLIGQHTLFSTLQKDLSFLSSMYLPYHKHWKEDGKGDPPDMQRWHYNAEDACKTYAIRQVQKQALTQSGLSHLDDFQQTLNYHVQRMIYKGVRIDLKKRAEFDHKIQGMIKEREDKLEYILGYLPNIKSPAQMAVLFYEDLGMKVQKSKKTGSTSTDDEALTKIAAKEPLVKPIVQMITELRSLYVFLNTFIRARLSDDGRLRTTFKVGGTVTYRFASSEDAFGNGANLQNIPDGKRSTVELPNVRELFIPDEGHTMFDVDLDSADLRIVTWEADVIEMKAMLAQGLKIYVEVMKEYFHNPNMTKHSKEYSMFKSLCHGCVTGDHEVLTKDGWKYIENVKDDEPIAEWSSRDNSISFRVPLDWYRGTAEAGETLISYSGESYSQTMTLNHRLPYTTTSPGAVKEGIALTLPHSARIPKTGLYSGDKSENEAIMRLYAAFQADGSFSYKGRVRWHFRRERKIKRIKELLNAAGISYKEYTSGKDTSIEADWYPDANRKVFGNYMLDYTGECLDYWLDELKNWDGHIGKTGSVHITTVDYESALWIQTIAHLRGMGSQLYLRRKAAGNRRALYHVSLNNRTFATASSMKRVVFELLEPTALYCPKTSTGYFLVRHNGKVSVTGNTNYVGTAKGLAERIGLLVHEVDKIQKWYFGKFPEILRWHNEVRNQVMTKKVITNIFGYRKYFFDRLEGTFLNEAVAWIPQSTVACIINRALVTLQEKFPALSAGDCIKLGEVNPPQFDCLKQVHDSLTGQYPKGQDALYLTAIKEAVEIQLPYKEPLIIPAEVHCSDISWGHCK